MFSIFKKELRTFFSSLTGYLVIVIFLLVNAWFLWIGRGPLNILDSGFASLSGLFEIAPWLFLFLVPAITMRTIADEKKSGTIELLLTQPITERQLILGKYLAAVAVAWLALLPTLIYFISVYKLGNPVGNIDMGGTWGSYIGLLLLAAGYAAIGMFASSLTDNQIVAFLVAATGCFLFYMGFDGLSALIAPFDSFLLALGIDEHYRSLSRGVIDWRDVLYFVSLIVLFLEAARLKLLRFKDSKIQRFKDLIRFTALVAALLLLNFVAHFIFFRIDLTSDRRYTLMDASKQVVKNLETNVLVQVYLDGDMPVEMKKLRTTIKETMDELKVYSHSHLQYEFVNISETTDPRDLNDVYVSLRERGLSPIMLQENAADGSRSERILFPGAIVSYTLATPAGVDTREAAVNFLQDNADTNSDESLLIAQQNVETALVNTIARIVKRELPRIAFVEGHGELDEYETGDISKELASIAHLDRVTINGEINALDDYAVVIIAKPTQPWPNDDKIAIDQYLMNGGRVAWFIDAVNVHHDSLTRSENTFALACQHGLDDQLFKYGVRINPNVVSDLLCAYLPVNIAPVGQTADFKLAPWTYYPLLIPPADHAITRGLNLIESKYPSTIDTVGKQDGRVHKQILLHSSENSRMQGIPALISLLQSKQRPDPAAYHYSFLPVATLLEGQFQSAFTNRPLENYNHQKPFTFKGSSDSTKMIVVADGDIIRNDVVSRADGTRIFPLGFDRYMNRQFGNRDFVKNCIYYLLDDDNTMQIRRREWTLRMLDRTKIYPQRTRWAAMNTALPIILTLLAGAVFIGWRKRKYQSL